MHGVSLSPTLVPDPREGMAEESCLARAASQPLQHSLPGTSASGQIAPGSDTDPALGLATTTCAETVRSTTAARSGGRVRFNARDCDGRYRVGSLLGGRYRVERVLGRGGMGVVVAAWDLARCRPVALKLLLPCYLEDDELRERFVREAEAAHRVGGENAPQIYDLEVLNGVGPCISMERLQGIDLAQTLDTLGRMQTGQAVDIALQACEALAAAHAAGIVHRDIKPANLFLARMPSGSTRCKLLDFGIAKLTTDAAPTRLSALTSATASVGSPLYMSPEQMRDASKVDHRTDIWSLGAVLYEMLTGRAPFDCAGATQATIQIMLAPPPRPSEFCPDVPRGLEKIVLKALRKKPGRRYRDAASFARALRRFSPQSAGRRWQWPFGSGQLRAPHQGWCY